MSTKTDIKEKISDAIHKSGKTYAEVATALGISEREVASYADGKKLPKLVTLANLCNILDLDPNEILCLRKN